MSRDDRGNFLQKASEQYGEQISLRALVQAIPYVGGSLDTLLVGQGAQIQKRRVEEFLKDLDQRMRLVENVQVLKPTDELFDLMINAFDGVVRTRSQEKRKRFASVVASQISAPREWDEADAALRLVNQLTDFHVAILTVARNAPLCGAPFEGLRVITLAPKPLGDEAVVKPTFLPSALPGYSEPVLRMACSELVGHGLLHDEGIGRWDGKPLLYFIATDLTAWFFAWLAKP